MIPLVLTSINSAWVEKRADKERRQIILLLRVLQTHLKSAIESSIVPGTDEPDPASQQDVYTVTRDRRDLQLAETLIKRLQPTRDDRSALERKTSRRVAKP